MARVTLIYSGSGKAMVINAVSKHSGTYIRDSFDTIDAACDFLQDSLQIPESEINDAVIKMHAHGHTLAIFQDSKLDSTSES